jgi:hypothetical protein
MRKQACFLFLLNLFLSTGVSNAQDVKPPCSASPLTGLTKLFVDAGDDPESRNEIIDVIGKEFPTLSIVDRKEQAEIVITYSHRVERRETDGVIEMRVLANVEAVIWKGQSNNMMSYATAGPCGFGARKEARRFARRFVDYYEDASK